MWYAEVLIKTYNEAGKRACETPDWTFYDAIKIYSKGNNYVSGCGQTARKNICFR